MRRAFADPNHGAAAGLLAAAVLACTPAAALIFRFNNPDALLVLLLTVAAYCLMRATPAASWRWLLLVGVAMGFAFLAKMLEGFLVLPGFGLAYLLCAPTSLAQACASSDRRGGRADCRGRLVGAGGAADPGERAPVHRRVDGQHGARSGVGLQRDQSPPWPSSGGHAAWQLGRFDRAMFGGHSGLHRLFTGEMANEISWLIVVALFVIAFGIYLAARRALSRGELCALLMWGTWLVVTGLVFSFMGGMVHPYYTVAMAPAVAGLVGIGAVWAWRRRSSWDGRSALAAMIVLAAGWSALLLHRNAFGPAWLPWLVAGFAVASAAAVLWPRPPVVAAGGRVRGRAGRHRGSFRRDRRDAAPRLDADGDPIVEGVRCLDERRSHQLRSGRPAGCDAHSVVGGDERFAVGSRARNRLGYIGDGHRRLEW